MSEYSNDLFMQLTRGNQLSMFAIGAGVRSVLLLYQFFRRLEKENILSGGEVEKFEKFVKGTGGRYDIMNIPYQEKDSLLGGYIKTEKLEEIKKSMDAFGIRYCILPDVNGPDLRMQVAVYQEDAQKFTAFYTEYLKKYLTGGEKKLDDFMNFTDGKASIISLPDASVEAMKEAMEKLRVDYAILPDLNLKDGELQISVANMNTDSVMRAYRLYQEGMLAQGRDVRDAKVMDQKQYKNTAKTDADTYTENLSPEIRKTVEKYEGQPVSEKDWLILSADTKPRDAGCLSFRNLLNDPSMEYVVIDKKELVDASPLARDLTINNTSWFFSRIPGTEGKEEKLAGFLKAHTFVLKDDDGVRFIAFAPKETNPVIVHPDGKLVDRDEEFPDLRTIVEKFAGNSVNIQPGMNLPSLRDVPIAAPVK